MDKLCLQTYYQICCHNDYLGSQDDYTHGYITSHSDFQGNHYDYHSSHID